MRAAPSRRSSTLSPRHTTAIRPPTPAAWPPDHYPVKIARDSIKPGTIIYDPNGHVATVWRVDGDGRIHYLDAHPDRSVTRGFYDLRFVRSSPGMGAGFKNWRPQTLVGATTGADGTSAAATSSSPPTRTSRTFPTNSSSATGPRPKLRSAGKKFVLNNETVDYYDYVRAAGHAGFYDPLRGNAVMVASNCADLNYRVQAVELAVKAGIDKQPEPEPPAQQHLRHRRRLGDLLHALARRPPENRLQGTARRGGSVRDLGVR